MLVLEYRVCQSYLAIFFRFFKILSKRCFETYFQLRFKQLTIN